MSALPGYINRGFVITLFLSIRKHLNIKTSALRYTRVVYFCMAYIYIYENSRLHKAYGIDLYNEIGNDCAYRVSRGKVVLFDDLNSRLGEETENTINSVMEYATCSLVLWYMIKIVMKYRDIPENLETKL